MRTKLITAALGALLFGGSTFAMAHGLDDLFRLLPHPGWHGDDSRGHEAPQWNDSHRDYRVKQREREDHRYEPRWSDRHDYRRGEYRYHDHDWRDHGRFSWHSHDRD